MSISLKFIGQCGFVISSGDLRLAIDPVLTDLIENGKSIRNYAAVMSPEDLQADYILCTHDHIDHLAVETVERCGKSCSKTKFVVPSGCVQMVEALGISKDRIIALGDLEETSLESGTLKIKGLSTAHPVHQKDENGLDRNLAYSLEFAGLRLVHLGDTYYTERLKDSLKALGKIDLLLPPINGMDEKKAAVGIIGNLSPEEAALLAKETSAVISIPTHFDMVSGNTADPLQFQRAMEKAYPEGKVIIPSLNTEINL